jgi:hypothetical protein
MVKQKHVIFPIRFKPEIFAEVKAAAAREDLQAVQLIRRAVVHELEALRGINVAVEARSDEVRAG